MSARAEKLEVALHLVGLLEKDLERVRNLLTLARVRLEQGHFDEATSPAALIGGYGASFDSGSKRLLELIGEIEPRACEGKDE